MNETTPSFTDLLLEPNNWSAWSARADAAPRFTVDPYGGPADRPALVVAGTGSPYACGAWRLPLAGLRPGRRYRVEAVFKTESVTAPGKSVRAILTARRASQTDDVFYAQLDVCGRQSDWHRVGCVFETEADSPAFTLNLFLAWSAGGQVRWGDVRLYDLTDTPPEAHNVTLAVVSGNPTRPCSPAECLDFYTSRLDRLTGQQIDLVCLPELVNITGVAGPSTDLAEPIPGPTSDRLSEKARDFGMYVAASILERQGDAVYNTGLLIDRTGGLVGKYRKTHLTLREGLLNGWTPGNDLSLFYTDFGTVGYMICYDGHFPEVPRVLALQGADVILFSNMGDGREGGSLWESVVRTRAVDNQVHIAAAVNGGRSCIVSPKGAFLGMTDRSPGATAVATCDLETSMCDFTGRPIHRRYDQLRRTDLFSNLAHHFWDGI